MASPESSAPAASITVIRRRAGFPLPDLREMWQYRELLGILALRDIKVRYKQTLIGALWAVLQPLTVMVVFTVLFRLLGRTPSSGDVPYAVTLYCALLPWQLFANALAASGDSVVANQGLVTKVYFPRLIIPLAPIVAGLIDFAIALLILLGMMAWYGIAPSWAVLALPLFILFTVLASLALGVWLAAINSLYRDFRYVIPFLVQVGMFVSPVIYETASLNLTAGWLTLYSLNPMVGVLEGFRWALLGKPEPPLLPMAMSAAAVLLVLTAGLVYFRRMERLFADWV